MSDICIILTTCAEKGVAKAIAKRVVDQSLAASTTIISDTNTYYAYEGTKLWDEEYILLIFTIVEQYVPVAEVIKEMHTYEIPEIFMVKIDQGSEDSMRWIRRMGRP